MDSQYLTLAEAAKLAPSRPSVCAIWRWARRGVKTRTGARVKLAHIRSGRAIFTTKADLDHFLRAVAEADAAHFDERPELPSTITRLPASRSSSHARAEEKLRRAGVL